MRLAYIAMASFALSPGLLAQARDTREEGWKSRLSAAIGRAAANNPSLTGMEARIAAARHRVPQADALPDPEVEVGIKDIPPSDFSLSRDDFTMEMVAGRQRFPAPGKRAAQRGVAEAQLAGASALYVRDAVRLAAEVADAFFQLAEIDRRVELLGEARERLKQAARSATERYRVGKGAQTDVLRANLETTALDERLIFLQSERRTQAARFNALQGLGPEDAVAPIGPVDPVPDARSAEELLRDAQERSPAVAAAAADLRRAQEETKLAALERRPDLTAMGYYAHRQKFEDVVGGSLSFNLPFAHPRRLEEKRSEAEALASAARADLEAARNTIRQEVAAALADLRKNREQAELYRSAILPQAEINFRAAREAYSVGQVDFLTFARASIDLSNYESEAAARSAGVGRSIAAVQKASGLALIVGTPEPGGPHEQK
jgi:outer membrane protein, heavy metal efflux system